MSRPNPMLTRLYIRALRLYPARFRDKFQQQIILTLSDAYRERPSPSSNFWLLMFSDLLRSATRERMRVMRDQMLKQPIYLHACALALVFTLLGGGAALTTQQMLRRGANQPQTEMADFYASEIHSGTSPGDAIPRVHVNLERDLQPFVIFYDLYGKPEKSSGYLDLSVPAPPRGVFEYIRAHGADAITWQPRPGVRIAAIARYVSGPNPGYVLAGRSLRLTEEYESLLWRIASFGWFAVLLLLAIGARLLTRAQRPQPAAV